MAVVSFWLVACAGLGLAIRVTAVRPDTIPVTVLALPMVLFVAVAPVPVESIRAVRAFQGMSAQGGTVERMRVVELANGMLEPFQTALWLALSVLVVACVVTWSRRRTVPAREVSAPAVSFLKGGSWMPVGAAVATGLVAVLLLFVAGVPSLVMEAGEAFAGADAAARARLTPRQYADAISTRLIVGAIGGASVAVLTALFAALVIATAGRIRRTRLTDLMSGPMVIVVGVLLAAGLVSVTRTLHRFATLAVP